MSETTRSDDPRDPETVARDAVAPVAEAVEATFTDLGATLTEQLARLSDESRQSVEAMVDDLLADFARLAAQRLIKKPLEGVFGEERSSLAGNALQSILKRSIRNG